SDREALQAPFEPTQGAEGESGDTAAGAGDAGEEVAGQATLPEPGAPVRLEVVDLDETTPDAAEALGPEPEIIAGSEEPPLAAVSTPSAVEIETPGKASLDLPDFLTGPDAIPTVEADGEEIASRDAAESDDTLAGMVRLETAERLERTANELLRGERGDWIRTLIADLGSRGPEIAVPRAFAAGYLAAKVKEEKS
ncbi:MAG: hypothetical protein JSU87_03470, partial [Gemmatimonadota bacterium]